MLDLINLPTTVSSHKLWQIDGHMHTEGGNLVVGISVSVMWTLSLMVCAVTVMCQSTLTYAQS